MKRHLYILITILASVICLFPSCRRTSHNGKIDGLWQVETIEYTQADGSVATVTPEKLYYGINLELFQIDRPGPIYTGEISYDKGGSTLGVRFTGNPTDEELLKYGVPSNPVVFDIERLDSKKLILKTSSTVMTCRRF